MFANGGTDDGPVGDTIMQTACLLAGGLEGGGKREAKGAGLFAFRHNNQQIQCVSKTNGGSNHHDHVHVGVPPA